MIPKIPLYINNLPPFLQIMLPKSIKIQKFTAKNRFGLRFSRASPAVRRQKIGFFRDYWNPRNYPFLAALIRQAWPIFGGKGCTSWKLLRNATFWLRQNELNGQSPFVAKF